MQRQQQQADLQIKLQSALIHMRHVMVLGSSNRIEDIKATNAWSFFQNFRSQAGRYYKRSDRTPSKTEEKINSSLEDDKWSFKSEWFFCEHDKSIPIKVIPRYPNVSPLSDKQFGLTREQMDFFVRAIKANQTRYGNCQLRAYIIAKYLWEHCEGIHRIEVVKTKTFDHYFILINREGNLHDYRTWGNAWAMDGWIDEGIIFSAAEFPQAIVRIKKFAIHQRDELKKIKIGTLPIDEANEEKLSEVILEIKPGTDHYPTYSTDPFYPLEYYYYMNDDYTRDLAANDQSSPHVFAEFATHKTKFADTLQTIRTLAENNSIQLKKTNVNPETQLQRVLLTIDKNVTVTRTIVLRNPQNKAEISLIADLVSQLDELRKPISGVHQFFANLIFNVKLEKIIAISLLLNELLDQFEKHQPINRETLRPVAETLLNAAGETIKKFDSPLHATLVEMMFDTDRTEKAKIARIDLDVTFRKAH